MYGNRDLFVLVGVWVKNSARSYRFVAVIILLDNVYSNRMCGHSISSGSGPSG